MIIHAESSFSSSANLFSVTSVDCWDVIFDTLSTTKQMQAVSD